MKRQKAIFHLRKLFGGFRHWGTLSLLFILVFPLATFSTNVITIDEQMRVSEILTQRVRDIVGARVSKDDFVVNVNVRFVSQTKRVSPPPVKVPSGDSKLEDREQLLLSKLGIWGPNVLRMGTDTYQAQRVMSLLNLIRSVEVVLTFNDTVAEEYVKSAESLIKENLLFVTPQKVTVKTKKINFPQKVEKIKPLSFGDQIQKYQFPVSVVLLCLFGLVMFFLGMGKWSKLEQAKIDVMEAQAQAAAASSDVDGGVIESVVEESSQPEVAQAPIALASAIEPESLKGFEQFRLLFEANPSLSSLYVKRWVNLGTSQVPAALTLLSQNMGVQKLEGLMVALTEAERKRWKKLLISNPTADDFRSGDNFIIRELIEATINPSFDLGEEVSQLLAGVTVDEAVACISKDQELGAVLLNTLPTLQVGKILADLEPQVAREVSAQAMSLEPNQVISKASDIKKMVEEIRAGQQLVAAPFADKAIDLIRELGPDKEGIFFETIGQSGHTDLLSEAVHQFFPAELIPQLPEPFLKGVLVKMPLIERASVIFVSSDALKSTLLKAFGEGGKLRELIDVELQMINDDENRKKQLERRQKDITWTFVNRLRQELNSNEDVKDDVEKLLEDWVSQKSSGKAKDAPAQAA